jgi:hypothetical protein
MRKYLDKYQRVADAYELPEEELRGDLRYVQALIGEWHLDASRCNRLGVIEGWIGQELRRRTSGLNGPLTLAS